MKQLKTYQSKKELDQVIDMLEENDINPDRQRLSSNEHALYVHIGDLIKARDLIIDWAKSQEAK